MAIPTITSLSTSPLDGTTVNVTITGTGFVAGSVVTFKALDAHADQYFLQTGTVVVNSTTSITVPVTTDRGIAVGDIVEVEVVNSNGDSGLIQTATLIGAYVTLAPIVRQVKPSRTDDISSPVLPVNVYGEHFGAATGVTVGGTTATFTITDDSHLSVTLPTKAVGTYDLVVTNVTGSSATSSADQVTYLARSAGNSPVVAPNTIYLVRDEYGDTLGAYISLAAAQAAATSAGPNYPQFAITTTVGVITAGQVVSWVDPA